MSSPAPLAGEGAVAPWIRELALAAVAALATLAAAGAADRLQPAGRARPGTLLEAGVFRDFGGAAEGRGRVGDEHAEIRLAGLWPAGLVAVELDLTAKVERRVRVVADGTVVVTEALVGPEPALATVRLEAPADAQGVLRLRLTGARREGTVFRLLDVRVRQRGPARLAPRRVLTYLLLGGVSFLLARRAGGPARALAASLAVATCAALFVSAARVQAWIVLPWAAGALAYAWATLAAADVAARVLDLPRAAGRWVAAALLLRVGLVVTPAFGSVDAHWHTHQLWTFVAGHLVVSGAPGVELSPYPPALYALLSPLVTKEFAHDHLMLRLAMGLMEGLAPLLVLAAMRAAGARSGAPWAAAAMAVMPEGVLVLAKGIAANITGSFFTLLLVVFLLRGGAGPVSAALLAAVLLSHSAVAISVGLLLAAWTVLEVRARGIGPGHAGRAVSWTLAAALVAWGAYYREVPVVLQDFGPRVNDPGVLGMRWYRLGKLAQDLVLKFGLGPLLLALAARASGREEPGVLRRLIAAWLAVAGLLAAVAMVSRFPLRFEYFALPALAMAAGAGAERWRRAGRGAAVQAALGLAMAIQVTVGLLWLAGRFEIISVILESPRWPFPVRW